MFAEGHHITPLDLFWTRTSSGRIRADSEVHDESNPLMPFTNSGGGLLAKPCR